MGGMDTLPRPLLPAPRPPCCSPLFLRHPKQAPSSCIWWKAGGRKVAEEGVFVHACVHLMCSPGSQLLVPGVLGGSRPQWSSWHPGHGSEPGVVDTSPTFPMGGSQGSEQGMHMLHSHSSAVAG